MQDLSDTVNTVLMIWYGSCGYWTDNWDLLKKFGPGIPCCPVCACPGFETTSADWNESAKLYDQRKAIGYFDFLMANKEKCFKKQGGLMNAWENHKKDNQPGLSQRPEIVELLKNPPTREEIHKMNVEVDEEKLAEQNIRIGSKEEMAALLLEIQRRGREKRAVELKAAKDVAFEEGVNKTCKILMDCMRGNAVIVDFTNNNLKELLSEIVRWNLKNPRRSAEIFLTKDEDKDVATTE